MQELVFFICFIIFSFLFTILALIASFICSYKAPSKEKSSIYECGMTLFSDAKLNFDFRYINYVVVFLIFDVETIFLFPFAVCFNQLGLFSIVEAFLFVLILLFTLFFVIKNNMLGVKE